MANIEVDAYKTIDTLFDNERGYAKLTYDFALDGGAYSGNTYRMALVNRKIVITEAVWMIETAVVGTSSTIDIGATTADPDCFGDGVAEATLVDDYAVATAAGQAIVVDAADYIAFTIGTADLTAGKFHLYLTYYNAV